MLFDLDGFKTYNDTLGHVAGRRPAGRARAEAVLRRRARGSAFRLRGDEFCVLLPAQPEELHGLVAAVAGALEEHGHKFEIRLVRNGAAPARCPPAHDGAKRPKLSAEAKGLAKLAVVVGRRLKISARERSDLAAAVVSHVLELLQSPAA